MTPHIMLDLETWSTANNAMIVSIGAAKFDPETFVVTDSIYIAIDPGDAQRFGLHIDANTVLWWMDPERDTARKEYFESDKLDLGTALEGFAMWVGSDAPYMWGNGAASDNVILRSAYAAVGVEPPWAHWADRCYRSEKNRTGAPEMPERVGTYHNPVDDAVNQVVHLKLICDKFGVTV